MCPISIIISQSSSAPHLPTWPPPVRSRRAGTSEHLHPASQKGERGPSFCTRVSRWCIWQEFVWGHHGRLESRLFPHIPAAWPPPPGFGSPRRPCTSRSVGRHPRRMSWKLWPMARLCAPVGVNGRESKTKRGRNPSPPKIRSPASKRPSFSRMAGEGPGPDMSTLVLKIKPRLAILPRPASLVRCILAEANSSSLKS